MNIILFIIVIIAKPNSCIALTHRSLEAHTPSGGTMEESSPSAGDESSSNTKLCTTRSLLDSADKFAKQRDGLNSLVDSPALHEGQTWKIRNPALRSFYCSSINSPPGTKPLRRSPRLAGNVVTQRESFIFVVLGFVTTVTHLFMYIRVAFS